MTKIKKKYIERTLEFHKIYQQEILPLLKSDEPRRKKMAQNRIYFWIFIVCSAILSVLFFTYWLKFTDQSNPFLPILSIMSLSTASICAFFPLYKPHLKFFEGLKAQHMHKILRVFGDISWVKDNCCITDFELNSSALFPNFDRRAIDDSFVGTYKGVYFKISETELFKVYHTKNGESLEKIFDGIILTFEANKKIKNRTIVATKGDITQKNSYIYSAVTIFVIFVKIILGFNKLNPIYLLYGLLALIPISLLIAYIFRRKDVEPLYKVLLEDANFSKRFNVYSSDQVEARYLLTTAFIDRFQNLKTVFGAKKIKCSFFGNQIMFAISTNKNLFEFANINTPLTDPKTVNELYDELSAIYKMIEYFKLDEKTGI